jgi:hypothetical protein
MKMVFCMLLLAFGVSSVSCKHRPTAEEQAADEKREKADKKLRAKVTTRLEEIAKLEPTLKNLANQNPKAMHGVQLEGKGPTLGSHANYDVLFASQLSDPSTFPAAYVSHEPAFMGCKNYLAFRSATVFDYCNRGDCFDDCVKMPYLVVVRPRTVETPKTGATTYTPGSLDADLFVFDLSNDKLVGGGHIVVKMDGVGTLDSKSAQNELDDAFGKAVDSAIRTELSISAGS